MSDRIRTRRLILRRAIIDDTAAMHEILSCPKAMRFWSTPPHATFEQTEQWMRSMVEVDLGISDDFIVTLDGALIGKLGAWRLPEVGFILQSRHWGRGYGLEAMSAFIDRRRAFGPAELTADVDPRNIGSLRLLERSGFRETHRATGTWNVGGEICDSVYLRLDL